MTAPLPWWEEVHRDLYHEAGGPVLLSRGRMQHGRGALPEDQTVFQRARRHAAAALDVWQWVGHPEAGVWRPVRTSGAMELIDHLPHVVASLREPQALRFLHTYLGRPLQLLGAWDHPGAALQRGLVSWLLALPMLDLQRVATVDALLGADPDLPTSARHRQLQAMLRAMGAPVIDSD